MKDIEIFAVIFQLKQLKGRPAKNQAPTGFVPMTNALPPSYKATLASSDEMAMMNTPISINIVG